MADNLSGYFTRKITGDELARNTLADLGTDDYKNLFGSIMSAFPDAKSAKIHVEKKFFPIEEIDNFGQGSVEVDNEEYVPNKAEPPEQTNFPKNIKIKKPANRQDEEKTEDRVEITQNGEFPGMPESTDEDNKDKADETKVEIKIPLDSEENISPVIPIPAVPTPKVTANLENIPKAKTSETKQSIDNEPSQSDQTEPEENQTEGQEAQKESKDEQAQTEKPGEPEQAQTAIPQADNLPVQTPQIQPPEEKQPGENTENNEQTPNEPAVATPTPDETGLGQNKQPGQPGKNKPGENPDENENEAGEKNKNEEENGKEDENKNDENGEKEENKEGEDDKKTDDKKTEPKKNHDKQENITPDGQLEEPEYADGLTPGEKNQRLDPNTGKEELEPQKYADGLTPEEKKQRLDPGQQQSPAENNQEQQRANQLQQDKKTARQNPGNKNQNFDLNRFAQEQQLDLQNNINGDIKKGGVKKVGEAIGKELARRIATGSFKAFIIALTLAILKDVGDAIEVWVDTGLIMSCINILISAALMTIVISQEGWVKAQIQRFLLKRFVLAIAIEFIPGVEFIPVYTILILYTKYTLDKDRRKHEKGLKELDRVLKKLTGRRRNKRPKSQQLPAPTAQTQAQTQQAA